MRVAPPGARAPTDDAVAPDGWRAMLAALGQARTWSPHRNPWTVFGFLWGLPIPLVTLAVECRARGLGLDAAGAGRCFAATPVQWLFLAHPLVFAAVFGTFGTMLSERRLRIARLVAALRLRADTDGLTGLANHRAFHERLGEEQARAARDRQPLSVCIADIDHFKTWNDRFGHPAGDRVLAALGLRLRALVRPYDIVARYGGEEFAVISPGLAAAEAGEAAERLRAGVAAPPLAAEPGAPPITISVGVATWRPDEAPGAVLARADAALYRAKRGGRNRVCSEESAPNPAPRD